ncbi:MAG: ATP-binding protein [Pseudomonadota bacterium]
MKRKQEESIIKDLKEKYVFLAGPRQAGKTTLARQLFEKLKYQYLSYDLAEDRQIIIKGNWSREKNLIILDEFHKHVAWKTFLKGYYDTEGNHPSILVTGSAKMNVFRKGNDSMVGRYFYHRLLPLSVVELKDQLNANEAVSNLLQYGNFPEPFLKSSKVALKRWQHQYLERVAREDVSDLSNVKNLTKIQLLIDLLRARVGSTISYSSLAQDIEVAPQTVKEWINLLEQLYIVFRVTPYHHNIARSILKEPKVYFFDCTMAFDEKAHLENLVAISLLKHLWFQEDTMGINGSLYFMRTKDGKEIDFLTVQDNKTIHAIEVKRSDEKLHPGFKYFSKFINPAKKYQLLLNLRQTQTIDDVQIKSVADYLSKLSI